LYIPGTTSDVARQNPAADRRHHCILVADRVGVSTKQARLFSRALQLSFRLKVIVLCSLVIDAATAHLVQLLSPLEIVFGGDKRGLSPLQVGDWGANVGRGNARERLPLLHALAWVDENLGDSAGDRREDVRHLERRTQGQ
jgi:hypothetical protein